MNSPITAAARQAAVLVTMLGDAEAANVLRLLDPDELREIGRAMISLDVVAPQEVADTLTALTGAVAEQGLVTPEPEARLRRMLEQAHGAEKAEGVMNRVRPEGRASALDFARWLDAPVLARLIADEHPQVVALLLTNLEPGVGALVLQALPPALHPSVLHRIATLQPVQPDALVMLEAVLARRVAQAHGAGALTLGGAKGVADILNNAARAVEATALPLITQMDAGVGRAIADEMVTMDHLLALDPKSIGALLRVAEGDVLILALKGLDEGAREVFFGAMSSRAADGVRDEIAARGRTRMADIVAAQATLIAQAKKLAETGEIALGGDGDFV